MQFVHNISLKVLNTLCQYMFLSLLEDFLVENMFMSKMYYIDRDTL